MLASVVNYIFLIKGKGTEDITNRYIGCRLIYLNIANIHAMRESFDKLTVACESITDKKWLSQLESTQWLQYLKSILKVTITAIINLLSMNIYNMNLMLTLKLWTTIWYSIFFAITTEGIV